MHNNVNNVLKSKILLVNRKKGEQKFFFKLYIADYKKTKVYMYVGQPVLVS